MHINLHRCVDRSNNEATTLKQISMYRNTATVMGGVRGLHSVTVNGILLHTLQATLTPRCLFLPFRVYNEFKHSWMKFLTHLGPYSPKRIPGTGTCDSL